MDKLIEDAKYYVDLKVKAVKLTLIEKLSLIFGKAMSLIAFILLLGMALLMFTGALVMLVYHWVGSLIWAFVIVGGFFAVVAVLFYFFRNAIFTGNMVKALSEIFFGEKKKKEEDDDEED